MTNPSQLINKHIENLTDWRGERVSMLRGRRNNASPSLSEDWKWETPVWVSNGMVVALGAFKDHVKINFFKGASLHDPHHLFNAGLEAKTMRSIDFQESSDINTKALTELIQSAVEYNNANKK